MNVEFHKSRREKLYRELPVGAMLVMFSGIEFRKTSDEYFPFFAERNFVYLTGLECKEAILLAKKSSEDCVDETLFILPPNFIEERWNGKRVKPEEASAISGIEHIENVSAFEHAFHHACMKEGYTHVYLDLYKAELSDQDRASHQLLKKIQTTYPYVTVGNATEPIHRMRTIKEACEIEALREAEKITKAGIEAMMKASRPGMYEYQYKAEYDRALGQFGPKGPGFPSIISAGANNFCIHYYEYTGQALDGDMVLNDVGAQHNNMITDVSRGWPCNGKFSDRQKLLFNCALETSNHMFEIIRPGMKMKDVDATIRRFNAERLVEAGVMKSVDEVGTYMWHGGAHHIGLDVHDMVKTPEIIAPGMAFCIDVGIYHEEWGIGFRLEDNCLVTENGCENLSAAIPRTVEDIEAFMKG